MVSWMGGGGQFCSLREIYISNLIILHFYLHFAQFCPHRKVFSFFPEKSRFSKKKCPGTRFLTFFSSVFRILKVVMVQKMKAIFQRGLTAVLEPRKPPNFFKKLKVVYGGAACTLNTLLVIF